MASLFAQHWLARVAINDDLTPAGKTNLGTVEAMRLGASDRCNVRAVEWDATARPIEYRGHLTEAELIGQRIEVAHDLWLESLEQRHQLVTHPDPQVAAVGVGGIRRERESVALQVQNNVPLPGADQRTKETPVRGA